MARQQPARGNQKSPNRVVLLKARNAFLQNQLDMLLEEQKVRSAYEEKFLTLHLEGLELERESMAIEAALLDENAKLRAAAQPRKRGRPPLPDERKAQALSKKQSGATDRECARIIYGIPYPTRRQVNNVPSILTYYRKKHPIS